MSRRIFNWTFTDVVNFLKERGFVYVHSRGSHYYYAGNFGGKPRIVQVPFHGSKTFKPRTFKGMVKQSGIDLDTWVKE